MVACAYRSAMDTYATCIGADGTPDEYIAIARFYETKSVSKAQPRQTVRQMISHVTRYIPPVCAIFTTATPYCTGKCQGR